MKMNYGLSMQQTQKLIMTPELRQAIAVLQMPAIELGEYIEQELLNNPALELKEETPEEETEAPGEEDKEPDWLEYFHDGSDVGLAHQTRQETEERSFENYVAQAPTLHEHLLFQLHLSVSSAEDRRVGEFLIGSIDENGFLTIDLPEASSNLGLPQEAVERVLKVIQTFDPAGVGARNLQECLLIQWRYLGDEDPLVEKIIESHLKDLGEGRYPRIAAALGVTPAEVQAAVDRIRTLDPKPGRKFGHPDDIRYVVPDIVVERVAGEYVVIVNDAPIPRLGISPQFRQLLKAGDAETKRFVENKMHSALWFFKAIEQRRLTLYKVMDSIVKKQRPFFDKGIRYLKPMTLREIASMIGMHESTVSRATSNKYVQTPHGVFELRFFFGSGVERAGGAAVSAESIKKMIRDLVGKEDAQAPLTDQDIAEKLGQEGISISRRTVAKYREEMGVAPSSKRKRY